MIYLKFSGAMLLGFVMDWIWVKYTVSRPFMAANYSFLIYLFGLFYTMMIVAGKFELVAGCLVGGYAGWGFERFLHWLNNKK